MGTGEHRIRRPKQPKLRGSRHLLYVAVAFPLFSTGCPEICLLLPAAAQIPAPASASSATDLLSQSPRAWADAAAANQERIITADVSVPLRYRERRVNAKGDTTPEVIESREGSVARLIERNGAPLTAEEDAAERDRLSGMLDSPDAFLRHHRRSRAGRDYALELMRAMPGAMLWSYATGQPQLPNASGRQIVLDFTPDPKFKPPTLITEGLTAIAGRVWLDAQTHCLSRIEGRILHPVNFGWGGMLAKVSQGGTVELEQSQVTANRWFYSRFDAQVTLREMLVHTVSETSRSSAWDAHALPAPISYGDAIHELLALPVPPR